MTTRTPTSVKSKLPPVRDGSAFMLRSVETPSRWLVADPSESEPAALVRTTASPDGSSFIVTNQRPSGDRSLLSGDPVWLNQACGQRRYLFAGPEAEPKLVVRNDDGRSTFVMTKVELASGRLKALPDGTAIHAGDIVLVRDTATNLWVRASAAGEPASLSPDSQHATPFFIEGYLQFVTFEDTFWSATAWDEERNQGFQELVVPDDRLICYVNATEEFKSHGSWRIASVSPNRVLLWLESLGSKMPSNKWGGEVRVRVSAVTVPASTPQSQFRALKSHVEL